MAQPLIIARNAATALQYAHQKGLRWPKIVTHLEHLDGVDVQQYQLFVVYGGIDPIVMTRLQELTKEARGK